ncbi:MAG: hypothetical protein GXP49_06535 [Deltaproteobacteria bacterium]|nr:hypothetical protein [Deltaproteobacteria bacterium]
MERDELKKHVLKVIRETAKPLMAKEIAARLREELADKGVEPGWPKRKDVNSVLYEMQGKKVSKSEDYKWTLMEQD